MQSPFPGMDPYIESCGLWEDFHKHLVEKIGEKLADALPERYVVRVAERPYLVLVESEGKAEHSFVPDVSVTTPRGRKKSPKQGGKQSDTAVVDPPAGNEPLVLRAFIDEEHREAFVEIYEGTPDQRLVTTVEVLSPSNKRKDSEGWHHYLRKRHSVMLGGVNLVEIDLLRGGQRMPMLDPWPTSPYTLLVARAWKSQTCKVWPAHFRHPLPTIPVPLAKPDPDLSLNLQPLVEEIYQRYRYARNIDYTRPLKPSLETNDKTWLAARLRERSRQS